MGRIIPFPVVRRPVRRPPQPPAPSPQPRSSGPEPQHMGLLMSLFVYPVVGCIVFPLAFLFWLLWRPVLGVIGIILFLDLFVQVARLFCGGWTAVWAILHLAAIGAIIGLMTWAGETLSRLAKRRK